MASWIRKFPAKYLQPVMKLKTTLTVSMVIAGVLPMLVSSVIVDRQARGKLVSSTYERLQADVDSRKAHLESYLRLLKQQNALMASGQRVQDAIVKFSNAFTQVHTDIEMWGNALPVDASLQAFYRNQFLPRYRSETNQSVSVDTLIPKTIQGKYLQHLYIADNPHDIGQKNELDQSKQSSGYDLHHKFFHPIFADFLSGFELYDVFLIEPENANVVYSVYKEVDYATSLFNGPHRDSGLARVARKALSASEGVVVTEDFSSYLPSYDAAALFTGAPVYENGKLLGALVFQIPAAHIDDIMSTHVGLGESGEAMLVGKDLLRRSQSRFSEELTTLRQRIDSDLIGKALSGTSGAEHDTTDGVDYIAAYAPVDLDGVEWAMLARMRADEALSAATALTSTAAMVGLGGALTVLIFAWWLGRRLYGKLGADPSELLQLAERIGDGDLTGSTPDVESGVGAFGAMVQMRARLQNVLREAHRVSAEVKAGVSNMSEGNRGLSERTQKQAANLDNTTSNTDELTSMVKHNATNANSANTLVIQTRTLALESGEIADLAVNAMQDISNSSKQISDIIGVIDEIAFQTNLLALNAAVEAARAGEQGRGFAVVASEVRQLAGRSATAAKQIKELISDSVSKVQDGTTLVQKSGNALEEIVKSVGNLTELVGQITTASDEQAAGIENINTALTQLDSMTQQNTSLVIEATQISESITTQATLLSEHIGYFRID